MKNEDKIKHLQNIEKYTLGLIHLLENTGEEFEGIHKALLKEEGKNFLDLLYYLMDKIYSDKKYLCK